MVTAIRAATKAAGRVIDDDHYGAGFAFYFGSPSAPALQATMEAYRKRTNRDPLAHFAVGDAETIMARISAYVAAGVSKFVLRPVGASDEEMLAQTRQLIEQVLPMVAARWPRAAKQAGAA
jgi:alkanesulfonate monooxygenase SsuD/methylene tetrahydromethanopterin reductase-like flavin-dependent oxidoreductase (luciferase family)